MKKLQELLKKIGFTKKHIDVITAEDAEFDVEEVADEVNANIQAALLNDGSFIDDQRAKWQGEVLSSKEHHLMRASGGLLTQAEIDELPKKDRFNKVVDLMVEKLKAEGSKPDADKDKAIQTLRTELQQRDDTIKDLTEVQLPAAAQKAKDVESMFHIKQAIRKEVSAEDRKTVLDSEKTVELLYADLAAEHDLAYDDGKVVLRQKGKDLLAYDVKDKSKPLGLSDVVPTVGEKYGYFVKNAGSGDGNRGEHDTVKGGERDTKEMKYKLPGLKKAMAAVGAEK